jgi:hypothetical protein
MLFCIRYIFDLILAFLLRKRTKGNDHPWISYILGGIMSLVLLLMKCLLLFVVLVFYFLTEFSLYVVQFFSRCLFSLVIWIDPFPRVCFTLTIRIYQSLGCILLLPLLSLLSLMVASLEFLAPHSSFRYHLYCCCYSLVIM